MKKINEQKAFKLQIGEVIYYVIHDGDEVTVVSITESHISAGVAKCRYVGYDNIESIIINYEVNKEIYEKKLQRETPAV